MRIICALAALLAAAALAAGCGDSGGTTATSTVAGRAAKPKATPTSKRPHPLGITIDWYVDGDHAPLVAANELGFFREAGLEVTLHRPVIPRRPLVYLAEGVIDLAISSPPQVVEARAKGVPVVAIGALVEEPITSMIWLPSSGVKNVADLKGKTVAIAGVPYEAGLVKAILAHAGVSPGEVEIRDVGYALTSALAKGRADAILGSPNIEGVTLRAQGLKPVIVPVTKLGVPPFEELVIVAREDELRNDAPYLRAFRDALAHGVSAAAEDPPATVEEIERNTELAPPSVGRQVAPSLRVLSESGYMDPYEWHRLVAWMYANHLIATQPQNSELFNNAYR
jgi:putative hydroxymethylpyrimidine transport system substrate-binding protein